MKLSSPFEVIDASRLADKQGDFLGHIDLLFPAYTPVTTNEDLLNYVAKLSDKQLSIRASVLRIPDTPFVILASKDLKHSFNVFYFKTTDDVAIVNYLSDHKGWLPSKLKIISKSLKYQNFRTDKAEALYEWEHHYLPKVDIDLVTASMLVEAEFLLYGVNCSWGVVVEKSAKRLGYCQIARRSGWLSKPHTITIGLNKSPDLKLVLHELAHAIDCIKYRSNNHGPTFMLIYRDLLLKYTSIDYTHSMVEYGLLEDSLDTLEGT